MRERHTSTIYVHHTVDIKGRKFCCSAERQQQYESLACTSWEEDFATPNTDYNQKKEKQKKEEGEEIQIKKILCVSECFPQFIKLGFGRQNLIRFSPKCFAFFLFCFASFNSRQSWATQIKEVKMKGRAVSDGDVVLW